MIYLPKLKVLIMVSTYEAVCIPHDVTSMNNRMRECYCWVCVQTTVIGVDNKGLQKIPYSTTIST